MDVRIYPSDGLSGTVSVPVSKSAMHRALICASGTEEKTVIYAKDLSDDVMYTIGALRECGCDIALFDDRVEIRGGDVPEKARIDAGESGSTLRFMLCYCAARGIGASFVTKGLLGERPLSGLLEELGRHGIRVDEDPLTVSGKLTGEDFALSADTTSQYVSGMLLALPFAGRRAVLTTGKEVTSRGYIDLTVQIMKDMGADLKREGYSRFCLTGEPFRPPREYVCEADWSGASFILAAGAAAGSAGVNGLDTGSIQPDRGVMSLLDAMGAKVSVSGRTVTAERRKLSSFDMSFKDMPDLVPAAAALATYASGTSILRDVEKLRFKESDRLSALTEGLGRLGSEVKVENGTMYVTPGEKRYAEVSSFRDHRIAMALAVAGLSRGCLIRDAECVSKSYPSFFTDLGSLGAHYDRIQFR